MTSLSVPVNEQHSGDFFQRVRSDKDVPKFFATLKASSGLFAPMLFGVGIPYYGRNQWTK